MTKSVEAVYIGPKNDGSYWVNVRNANPQGMIGDGGVIRRFDTKEEAKNYADKVNSTGTDTFEPRRESCENCEPQYYVDEFYYSSRQKDMTPPDISWGRVVTGFLTDEQVERINATGKLPENVKFVQNGYGGYSIVYNYLNVTSGTHDVPKGFEVKRDFVGMAHVVPVGTDGLIYK